MGDADVARKRVAPQQRQWVSGTGTDQGYPRGTVQRQDAVILEQHCSLLGDLTRQGAVRGRVEVDGATQGLDVDHGPGVALGLPLGVKQAETDLLVQHPSQRTVHQLNRHRSGLDLVDQRRTKRAHGRKLNVHTSAQRQPCRVAPVLGHAVQDLQEGNAEVVGHHRAVESPGVTQKRRQ